MNVVANIVVNRRNPQVSPVVILRAMFSLFFIFLFYFFFCWCLKLILSFAKCQGPTQQIVTEKYMFKSPESCLLFRNLIWDESGEIQSIMKFPSSFADVKGHQFCYWRNKDFVLGKKKKSLMIFGKESRFRSVKFSAM